MRKPNTAPRLLIFCGLGCLLFFAFIGSLRADSASAGMDARLPGFSLIGVILMQGKSPSAAILKNTMSDEIVVVREGEDIRGLKLVRVLANRIILQNGEGRVQMFLRGEELTRLDDKAQTSLPEAATTRGQETPVADPQPDVPTIRYELVRDELERRAAEEWTLIMREAKIVPFVKNDGVRGFKVAALPEASFVSFVGILANDIIREVNGVVLNDMKTLFSLYERFREENRFEVLLERGGKPLRLVYVLR